MIDLAQLAPAERQAIFRTLEPNEDIAFLAVPDGREAAKAAGATAMAGALLVTLSAPLAFLSGRAAWDMAVGPYPAEALIPALFALLSFLGCGLGAYLLLLPWAAWRRANDSLLVITNRRMVLASLSKPAGLCVPAHAILDISRRRVGRRSTSLIVRHEAAVSADGHSTELVLDGFSCIDDAEAAIRSLAFNAAQDWATQDAARPTGATTMLH